MADPQDLFDDIRTIAARMAKNETTTDRFKSWSKQKIHKLKKPGNVVKTAAQGAGAAIPIPGISLATDWVIQKAADRKRAKSHLKKAAKYGASENNYHKVKWDIKDLDVKHLDQSRRKVHDELKKYNKLAGKIWPNKTCERAYELVYAVERTNYRMDKLRLEAEAMKVVAEQILNWCDQVDSQLNLDTLREQVEKALNHDSCGNECYHSPSGSHHLTGTAARYRHFPNLPR